MTAPAKSKAGISWPVQEQSLDPLAKFLTAGSKVSWYWNWNKNTGRALLPHSTDRLILFGEFVPMIFAPSYFEDEHYLQGSQKYIMGYNEPDMDNPAVAQMSSVEHASREWMKIAALRKQHGIKLVSPAVAYDLGWMKTFLRLLPSDARPDYLAVHIYTTTFEAFRKKVEEYRRVFGLPIWVTEFAMSSFDPNVPQPSSQQQVHDFMGQTTKWLDETDYVMRYSWFGACRDGANLHGVHPYNRLMDEAGELTALGNQYLNGGHD